MHKGSCLCGAVSFVVEGELSPPDACHCTICRKHSGHYYAGTEVKRDALTITGTESITWYQSSPKVRRGFCAACGSSLFFDPPQNNSVSNKRFNQLKVPGKRTVGGHRFDSGILKNIENGLGGRAKLAVGIRPQAFEWLPIVRQR